VRAGFGIAARHEMIQGMVDTPAPFSLDGAVGLEKLTELLGVGTELAVLDYKRTLDLGKGSEKDRVELAKDIAAFSTLPGGGYIVVGVDGTGAVETDLPSPDATHFDEATLREIATHYMDGRLNLVTAAHTVDPGRTVVVIFVGATLDGLPPVMTREGSYPLPSGERKVVFRAGDVFTRVGTSCRRITHGDWVHLLAGYRDRVRAEAASDTQEVIARVAAALRQDGGLAGSRQLVIDLGMSATDFEDAVDAALGDGNVAAVQRALRPARGLLASTWRDDTQADKMVATLDRVASVAGVALRHSNEKAFTFAIDTLYKAYRSALQSEDNTHALHGSERQAAVFWREIAARILGILASAIRVEAWSLIRPTVLRPIGGDYSYRSWLRHAVTEASGANVLVSKTTGEATRGAIIRFARQAVLGIPSLHDDVPEEELALEFDAPAATVDVLLDTICQADFLWCVVAVADNGGSDDHQEFYPSCSALYDHRTAPIAQTLARHEEVRREVTGQPDKIIAASLVAVDRAASSQAGWRPWSVIHGRVERFVQENN
jgi:hypothetical protein